MTARKFYQRFLRLYPEPFRHEFEDEMLSIFDECRASQGSWRLLVDLLLSVAKQQIHYRSTPVPTNAPLYSEVNLSPHLGWLLGIAALSAALMAGAWMGRTTETRTTGAVIPREAIYWFPIVPQGRYCYGRPEHTGKPELVLTTGVWVRGNSKTPEYWTVVQSKTRFWISITPWGQYCWDALEHTGRSASVL